MALPIEELPDAPRRWGPRYSGPRELEGARFVRPLRAGPAVRVTTIDSTALPVPAAVLPFLRDTAQYGPLLKVVMKQFVEAPPEGTAAFERGQQFMRLLMALGPGDERVGAMVLAFLPPRRCAHCRRRFLSPAGRAVHCSDACRRAASA